MFNKKPPLNVENPKPFDKLELRKRAETPSHKTPTRFQFSEVPETRAALSGQSSPVAVSSDPSFSQHLNVGTLFKENFLLKKKISTMQDALNSYQDSFEQKKIEYYEAKLKQEIQKRLEIEKQFANEADQIQEKVHILEEQGKQRNYANELIGNYIETTTGKDFLDRETKVQIRKAYGEGLLKLINAYEKRIKHTCEDLQVYLTYIEKTQALFNPFLKFTHNSEPLAVTAEQIYARISILESYAKAKTQAEEILSKLVKTSPLSLDKESKLILSQVYGENLLGALEGYEKKLKPTGKEPRSGEVLDKILGMVLPTEDKARTLRFIKEGDLESAACILKNQRADFGRKSLGKTDMGKTAPGPFLEVPRMKARSSASKGSFRSRTPTGSCMQNFDLEEKAGKKASADLIVYLQCQASALEDFLINN